MPSAALWRDRIRYILVFLPCLVVLTRFLWPLTLPFPVKMAVAILLAIASQYHQWSRLSSGSVFAPEFPRMLVILFNWAFGAMLFLALMLLTLDAARLLAWPILGARAIPDEIRYLIAAFASVLAAIGVFNATRTPTLKDIEVGISGLPVRFDGYTMLQLTDLHISRLFPAAWVRAVVEKSNALRVDLIVVTGDLIDGSVAMRRDDVAPLSELMAIDGVFVIPGNHEYFFDYQARMRSYAAMGMQVLTNGHVVIEREGGMLVVAGVTDQSAPASGNQGPDLAAALAGSPVGAPIILLDHQPRQARRAAASGVALQLSGHTHGGMLRGLDRLVARGNGGYVSGRYDVDGMMTLYVNNGTALWPGFALRLGRPAELTRITLRSVA